MAPDPPVRAPGRQRPRVLGVFAHPDDETICAGGTFAKYAGAGADVRVVSLTRGGAGQIRDAAVATRATLRAVREAELAAAGAELGLSATRCLDHPDGGLADIDGPVLVDLARDLVRDADPDVVVTFGPDGFSGHPDHVAVGRAVTAACQELRPAMPVRLFHCHLPRSGMLLRDRLAAWVVDLTERFRGTQDFVQALSVFSRETTSLGYAADFGGERVDRAEVVDVHVARAWRVASPRHHRDHPLGRVDEVAVLRLRGRLVRGDPLV